MIIPDKKKVATIIVSKMSPGKAETLSQKKPEETFGGEDQDLHTIAEGMLHALDSKSAHELVDCLKAYKAYLHGNDDDDEEEEEE